MCLDDKVLFSLYMSKKQFVDNFSLCVFYCLKDVFFKSHQKAEILMYIANCVSSLKYDKVIWFLFFFFFAYFFFAFFFFAFLFYFFLMIGITGGLKIIQIKQIEVSLLLNINYLRRS